VVQPADPNVSTLASAAEGSVPAPLPAVAGYEVERELGRGGMGVVYLARDLQLNRPVALKMILSGEYAGPEQLRRFRNEAETAARVHHPGIVEVHHVGEHDGRPFLVMEYCAGGNLS
jgi:serine/threonine-protein kinase